MPRRVYRNRAWGPTSGTGSIKGLPVLGLQTSGVRSVICIYFPRWHWTATAVAGESFMVSLNEVPFGFLDQLGIFKIKSQPFSARSHDQDFSI